LISVSTHYKNDYSRKQNERKNQEINTLFSIQAGSAQAGLERYLLSNREARVIAAEALQMRSMISPIKAAQMKVEGNFSFAQMRVAKKYGIYTASLEKISKIEERKKLEIEYQELLLSSKPKQGEKVVIVEVFLIFFFFFVKKISLLHLFFHNFSFPSSSFSFSFSFSFHI